MSLRVIVPIDLFFLSDYVLFVSCAVTYLNLIQKEHYYKCFYASTYLRVVTGYTGSLYLRGLKPQPDTPGPAV